MISYEPQDIIIFLEGMVIRQFCHKPDSVSALPGAGSNRKYFRIVVNNTSVIGSYNPDKTEHEVFVYLADHFKNLGLPVPSVLATQNQDGLCLIEDLGDETLLKRIEKERHSDGFNDKLNQYYQQAINHLIRFQIDGNQYLDYSKLPVPEFDAMAMRWDLNYFKYYFLKPSGILFDEAALEHDFGALVHYLSAETLNGFMYRDFQARNIMVRNNSFFYIDFQGGRKGPLQYDLVSLLFQVKAAIPDDIKESLIEYYLQQLEQRISIDKSLFRERFNVFVLLRILQVMGAYGFRGWFERKNHFIESIPLLNPNLEWLLRNQAFHPGFPEIERIIKNIMEKIENKLLMPEPKLAVHINSFSYRRGIPYDPNGNGGGYVFDCRLLPNPGRFQEYSALTGKDDAVIAFLESKPLVASYIRKLTGIVNDTVESYLDAGFTNLQINLGCTGGRHRSVYCAENLAQSLHENERLIINLHHLELKNSI